MSRLLTLCFVCLSCAEGQNSLTTTSEPDGTTLPVEPPILQFTILRGRPGDTVDFILPTTPPSDLSPGQLAAAQTLANILFVGGLYTVVFWVVRFLLAANRALVCE